MAACCAGHLLRGQPTFPVANRMIPWSDERSRPLYVSPLHAFRPDARCLWQVDTPEAGLGRDGRQLRKP